LIIANGKLQIRFCAYNRTERCVAKPSQGC